ncbi:hypothetical protein D9M69_640820 [compost metagenome]
MALHTLRDQALQHLVLQGLVVGHLDAAGFQFARDALGCVAQLAQRDHVLVDDGCNPVDELLALRSRSGVLLRGRGLRAVLCGSGLGAIVRALAVLLGRICGRQAGAHRQQQRITGEAAQRVQPTHHSYLSNVVPAGTGGVMRE